MSDERVCFISEWLDPQSGVLWKYQLFWYPASKEVEIVDIKNRKHLLKKTWYQDLKPEHLFVGSTVTVYARQMKIVDYGDDYTRAKLTPHSERTLAMVKPDAYQHLGKIIHVILEAGFRINNLRVCHLTKEDAEEFYAVHRGKPFFEKCTTFMSSGRIAALELVAPGAVPKWRELIGPTDSNKARAEAPHSIRAHYGTDVSFNAVHGSDGPDTAAAEIGFFFASTSLGRCHLGRDTTLGIVKPHALVDGSVGPIIDIVLQNYDITALRQVRLDKAAASEFCDVYKAVLAPGQFTSMVEDLASGPCIAFEVAARQGGPPVEAFRELCGPLDPELARVLRPKSLRAQFGQNKIRNAVHCTDLPEDGQLEVEYFFNVLS